MCPSGYDTGRDDLPFGAIAQLFPRPNTVITMKPTLALTLLGTLAFGGTASAQKTFEWQPANDESVRLDPANYHTGRTYRPGPRGGNLHVDIVAQQPVTIFMTGEADWNQALQYPEAMGSLRMLCLREHVVKTTYLCDLPGEAMTLVVRDDRGSTQSAAYAGLGEVLKRDGAVLNTPAGNAVGVGIGLAAVLKAQAAPSRHFKSPNDLHIQHYRWACISNCFPPEFQWIQQPREKYKLTPFLKVNGGYTPDRGGALGSHQKQSPTPTVVATGASSLAQQLHSSAEMLEAAVSENSCH